MTAKQRQARERFKKVVQEASKLRKKNKKLTQAQAVKQAWAIQYSKEGKSKKVGYSSDRLAVVKKATKGIKTYLNKGYSRRDAIRNANIDAAYSSNLSGVKAKVKAKRSKKSGEMHTDTKSHNVNIRVVSGIVGRYNNPENILQDIEYWQKQLTKLRAEYKSPQGKLYKHSIMQDIKIAKKWLELRKQALKKVITSIK